MDLGHFLRHDLYFRCGKKVKSMVNLTYQSSTLLRLFQHTELEHTPSNLYQQAISRDSFHNWRTGDWVYSGGVLQFSWNSHF